MGIHKSLNKGKAAKPAHPLPKSNGKAAQAAPAAKPKAAAAPVRGAIHKSLASAKVARPATRNTDILTKLRAAPAKPVVAAPPVATASPTPSSVRAASPSLGVAKHDHKPLEKKVALMPSPALKTVKTDKPELKTEVKKKLDFRSQDWVVYPAHGVGRIVSIEENEVAGMKLELFVISFEKDKMTLRVPVAKARAVGMRRLSSPDVVQNALATLKGRARIKRTMWSRRAQEYEQKIHSGDLISIAEVVRDLHRASGQPEQSYSERQLYEAAIGRLAREVAAVERIDEDAAMKRLETALVKAAA